MSRPSSAIEVATRTFISPRENFSIISFCSDCFKPVFVSLFFSLEVCFFIACPTKIPVFTFSILSSSSEIFLTVSLNWEKMIIFSFLFLEVFSFTISMSFSSFGCSCSNKFVREKALENRLSVTRFWTPFDFFSEACLYRSLK